MEEVNAIKQWGRGSTGPGLAWVLSGFLAISGGVPAMYGDTYVNRVGAGGAVQDVTLTSSTWSAANSPYIVEAKVTVGAGATLTVEPNVTVQVNAGRGLYVNGVLIATNATFTVNGGGNWRGMYLSPDSGASVLSGCALRRAGGDWLLNVHGDYRYTTLYVDGCSPAIIDCTIADSGRHGIELWQSQAVIKNTQFQNLAGSGYSLVLDSVDVFPVLSGNSVTGTGIAGIAVPGGTLNGTNRWNNPGQNIAYFLNGDLTVAQNAQWILDPGVTVKTAGLKIWVAGTLDAQGTAANPIVFTSRNGTPAAGNWRGIYFGPKAGDSVLSYVTVAYGGDYLPPIHGDYRYSAIYLDSCSPQFDHLTVAHSRNNGIEMWGSSARIDQALITGCARHGLRAESDSWPGVSNTRFAGNGTSGYYTIGTDATSVPDPDNVTFETNRLQGVQIWGGTLSTNARWKNWSTLAPYVVTDDVSVKAGVTLTVEQGAAVKFQNKGLYVYGALIANGDPGRISFTSWRDDSIGGDTNGDSTNSVAAADNWKGIYLSAASDASVLHNCLVRYAGSYLGNYNGNYRYAALYLDGCSPTISNSLIADSSHHGIEMWSSLATIRDNQFNNFGAGHYALAQDTPDCNPGLTGNTVSGSGILGISLPGGTLAKPTTWHKQGGEFPYFLNADLTVAKGVTLTIEAGVTVKMAGQRIWVEGTIDAQGTAADPILFTSRNATPSWGNWRGIYLGTGAGDSVFKYVTLAYAGDYLWSLHGEYRYTAIYLDSCSPELDHLTVSNSYENGVEMWASSATFNNLDISGCGRFGLRAETGSRPLISHASFTGNGKRGNYTIGTDASSVPEPTDVTFTTNSYQGIQIWGGTLATNALWKNWSTNAPYVVTDDVSVRTNVTLTLEPGAAVKFQGKGLYIYGTLIANGDPDRISFTSWRDDSVGGDTNGDGTNSVAVADNWKGIYLSRAAGASVLNNCLVRYAGSYLGAFNGEYRYAAIYVDGSSPTIMNSTIADSSHHGLELWSSQAVVQDNEFSNFGTGNYAIVQDTIDCNPQFTGNRVSGSGIRGIYVPGGTLSVPVTWHKSVGDFPYYLNGELTVAEGTTLTIEPGVTVQTSGQRILVYGTLNAPGTEAEPIVFTSRNANPAPGNWRGIYLGPAAGSSVWTYVTVAYAGDNVGTYHGEYRYAAIYVDSCSPTFDHLILVKSANNGFELYSSNARISDSEIRTCGRHGLRAEAGSRPRLINSVFEGNGSQGYYTIGTDASSVPDPVDVRFETNRYSAIQIWGGTLNANALWKHWATNAPYLITQDTAIGAGVHLTLEPGTVVKLQNRGIYVYGTLSANGDPAPITFTSWRDDAVAGDSNGDGTNSLAAPDNWKGIYFSPASSDSVLNQCRVQYGGAYLGTYNGEYRYAMVYVNGASTTITNCVIADSSNHGIELWSGTASLQGNNFRNMGVNRYPIVFDHVDTLPIMSDNTVSGSGLGGIAVPGGTFSASGAWSNPGQNFPYLLNGDLGIAQGNGLRIDPGVEVRSSGPGIYVYGTLAAAGTAGQPVVFTSRNATPKPGDWKGLYFGPKAGNSVLSYCTVAYTGAYLGAYNGEYRYTAIYLDASSPRLNNLTVLNGSAYGLQLYASAASLSSSLICSNAWSNLRLDAKATPTLINNTIVRSGMVGIYCTDASPWVVNNILAFNKTEGIKRDAGTPILRNNCVFGNTGSNYFGLPPGAGDLSVDPQFVNADAGDFHLSDASPGLNAGDTTVIQPDWMDLDGKLRMHGAQVDLGAYEWGAPVAEHLVDELIRNMGEAAYAGEQSYSLAEQTKTQTVNAGVTAVYQFKVKYDGNLNDHLSIMGAGGGKGWTVRYFDSLTGNNEITGPVANLGGWVVTNLNPGSSLELRVEVTPDFSVPGHEAKELRVTALANGEPSKRDMVRAVTINAPRAAVDLLVRRAEDIRYLGEGIFNNDGAGQSKIKEVDTGETAVFDVQVHNLGNIPDQVRLRGSAGGAGWTVRYFDSLISTNDITASVTGAGWTNATLPLNASLEFRVEITADTNAASGALKEVLVTATSLADNSKSDTVKALINLSLPSATPQGRTYTLDADFENSGNATLVGLEYQTVHDQLQLAAEAVTLPFIWVPDSNIGAVSKVDTRTGKELGRYRTGPAANGNPSRTTVDQQGNCWVANRHTGTVIKIGLYENGQYEDRNGNGIIETSQDLNGDGTISGAEMLPWGQDECVLYEIVMIPAHEGTFVPGTFTGTYANDYWNPGPRGIAVDARGNVWAGTYEGKRFYYLEGSTARILRTNDLSSLNTNPSLHHSSYGAVIDAQGILWSASLDHNHLLRLDPADNSYTVINLGHNTYGLGLDRHNHLFVSGGGSDTLSRVDTLTGAKQWTVSGLSTPRGVAVTEEGDVWIANSGDGHVLRYSNDGALKVRISVGNTPTGVSVDAAGKVWAVNNGDEYIERIDPATDTVDLSKRIVGATHYGYSDMTGIIARTATTQFGRWIVTHNAKVLNTPWGTVAWHSLEPDGASVKVRARSSNDQRAWSLWEKVLNSASLNSTPPGKYLQVEVTLQVTTAEVSPVLYDLSVAPAGEINLGQEIYHDDFQGEAGPEWSSTPTDITPAGERKFLGQFGNTNITLTLTNLPPHVAVSVAFDVLVIRSWDGNNSQDGPDLWELNVAGGRKLVYTTFNNAPTNSGPDGQTHPDTLPGQSYPPQTGAAETNTLGFVYPGAGIMDSVYKLSQTLPHTADSLVLNFSAAGLSPDLAEESWGLDNVRVFITPRGEAPVLLAVGSLPNGSFQLQMRGEPEQNFRIESSMDLVDWTLLYLTNTMVTNVVDLIDTNAPSMGRCFYRAVQQE